MVKDLDLVGKLTDEERAIGNFRLTSISPDDGKYGEEVDPLRKYLSPGAEWLAAANFQKILLQKRVEYGQASEQNLREADEAIEKIDLLNIELLESEVTHHDQLAVIEELGRYVSPETKALLHPGTTSYDVVDTIRASLFKNAWHNVMRPAITKSILKLAEIAERCEKQDLEARTKGEGMPFLQTGRTHLQDTSPVPIGAYLAGFAARFAGRVEKCDEYFGGLKGKVSGIVGTGASIDVVISEGKSIQFEKDVLTELGLEPDYTATQITQKERLSDVGHGLVSLMHVLKDFSDDMRILYSSAIGEVTSRDNAESLGGSSADAMKNNPVDFENMSGKVAVVEGGMRVLYDMITSNLHRDLRNSVQGRYQPQAMMAQSYESFVRLNKSLGQLSVNTDRMAENLMKVRDNPSEAMVAILRSVGWVHPKYGVGHDFVKEMGKIAKRTGRKLLDVALEDAEFAKVYEQLPERHGEILHGKLEKYIGSAPERAIINIAYARKIAA